MQLVVFQDFDQGKCGSPGEGGGGGGGGSCMKQTMQGCLSTRFLKFLDPHPLPSVQTFSGTTHFFTLAFKVCLINISLYLLILHLFQ